MTGLVYLAIIALWAVFLIPWLGRHRDEQNGRRSGDRYNRAMDTLARGAGTRHESSGDESDALDEDIEVPAEASWPGASQAWSMVVTSLGRPGRRSRTGAARRRRRVLAVLLLAQCLAVAAYVADAVPIAVPVGVAVSIAAYLAVLVSQAVRSGRHNAPTAQQHETQRLREATRRAQEQARGLLSERPSRAADSTRRWDAVPTTLPTYVSKPKASKVPRVVDLTAPGHQWTGEAMVQAANEERQKASRAAAQAQFDREMSVLEGDPVAEVSALANMAESPDSLRTWSRRVANG